MITREELLEFTNNDTIMWIKEFDTSDDYWYARVEGGYKIFMEGNSLTISWDSLTLHHEILEDHHFYEQLKLAMHMNHDRHVIRRKKHFQEMVGN